MMRSANQKAGGVDLLHVARCLFQAGLIPKGFGLGLTGPVKRRPASALARSGARPAPQALRLTYMAHGPNSKRGMRHAASLGL